METKSKADFRVTSEQYISQRKNRSIANQITFYRRRIVSYIAVDKDFEKKLLSPEYFRRKPTIDASYLFHKPN